MSNDVGPRLRLRAVVRGLLGRRRLRGLERRYGRRLVLAAFGLLNGAVSIGILGGIAYLTASPFIFPSLGPTAFLVFYRPLAATSAPRNAVLGHLIGGLAGLGALVVFGLVGEPPAVTYEISGARIGAAALSLGATSGLMIGFRVPHPPACATTLIVSLGLMPFVWQLPVLMGAVLLLLSYALLVNRIAGVRYPVWRSRAADDTRFPAR